MGRDLIPVVKLYRPQREMPPLRRAYQPRYPLIELNNAGLYLAVYLRFGLTPDSVLFAAFLSGLVVAAWIDIDQATIPK